jgi:hypothetical protein
MSEWISVNDRLPDPTDIFVIVCRNKGAAIASMACMWLDGEFIDTLTKQRFIGATHWMPMPEPPGVSDE